MKKYPLDPSVEMFRWGPVPIHIFYGFDFVKAIFVDDIYYRATHPEHPWPGGLCLKVDGRFCWVNEFPELRECGAKAFWDLMYEKSTQEEIRKKWLEDLSGLEDKEREIDNLNLEDLSEKEFWKLWEELHHLAAQFWRHVTVPELANYGSPEILEDMLLKDGVPESELSGVMEVLTAPDKPSFYQEEELDLLKTGDIDAHAAKYFWLKNGYGHVEVLGSEFFEERKKELSPNLGQELKEFFERAAAKKKEVQAKYNLSRKTMKVAERIVDCITWQDTRKKDIIKYLHYSELLLNEAVRRYEIDKNDLLNYSSDEIRQILGEGGEFSDLEGRRKAVGYNMRAGKVEPLTTGEVLEYWKIYVEEKVEEGIKEFRGVVASKGQGKVEGRVRIVLDPHDVGEFNQGDILVTSMTTPEFIFVMKKAAAIVTDAGGLTSHAAIVSRELGVPCLVGTRIATTILKDGMKIEVDASKGTVKILEKDD